MWVSIIGLNVGRSLPFMRTLCKKKKHWRSLTLCVCVLVVWFSPYTPQQQTKISSEQFIFMFVTERMKMIQNDLLTIFFTINKLTTKYCVIIASTKGIVCIQHTMYTSSFQVYLLHPIAKTFTLTFFKQDMIKKMDDYFLMGWKYFFLQLHTYLNKDKDDRYVIMCE